jgi:phosphoglycolate phosphatase
MNIIFDFDGTIVDTYSLIKDEVKILIKKYSHEDIKFKDLKEYGFNKLIKKAKVRFWNIPRITLKLKKLVNENINNVDIKKEIDVVIRKLSEKNTLYLVSGNSKNNIVKTLEKLNMLKYFKLIYADATLFGKDRLLKKLLKKEKLDVKNCIYIGDEDRDVEACKNINMKIISVTWGYNSKKLLEEENPDFIVDEPSEILKYT